MLTPHPIPPHPASLAASNLGAPGGGFGFGGYAGSTRITVPADSKAPPGADVELAAVESHATLFRIGFQTETRRQGGEEEKKWDQIK